jgi:hypothetical protein
MISMRLNAIDEDVRSELLTAVTVKNKTFWVLPPYSLVKVHRSFGGISACCLDIFGFVLGLLFDPKDGSDTFLRNVRVLPPN